MGIPDARRSFEPGKKKLGPVERAKQMASQVNADKAEREFGRTVFYLQKHVGLSRNEIFGGSRFVQRKVDGPRRSGVVGWIKDALFGRRQRVETFEAYTPGMRAETFASYIELCRDEAERMKKKQRRNQARGTLRGM